MRTDALVPNVFAFMGCISANALGIPTGSHFTPSRQCPKIASLHDVFSFPVKHTGNCDSICLPAVTTEKRRNNYVARNGEYPSGKVH